MNRLSPLAACVALSLSAAAGAQSCSSDGEPRPRALLERFISADCETCWSDPKTPEPAAGAMALDWIAPGRRGDDAPLSAAATRDALERLHSVGKDLATAPSAFSFSRVTARAGTLRVAHGPPVNGYIGTSIELDPRAPGRWIAWLLLVETLPAGLEGSPVERNLVRNALRLEWHARQERLSELRPMRIAEGARAQRLSVVGWVEEERGRVTALSRSRCP